MKEIDQLLLDGILNPDKYKFSSLYPAPINSILREELVSLGILLTEDEIKKRITYASFDSIYDGSICWFLDERVCLLIYKHGKVSKPYRENMYKDIKSENLEDDWSTKIDIDSFVYRQVKLSDVILSYLEFLKPNMTEKMNYVSGILEDYHVGQKKRIGNILDLNDIKKESLYLDTLLKETSFDIQNPDMLIFWLVLLISYMRDINRYSLLKNTNTFQNTKYLMNDYTTEMEIKKNSNMWEQFYLDSKSNINLILDFLFMNYDEKELKELINKLMKIEAKIINNLYNI